MGTVGLEVPVYSKGGGGVIISSLHGHCWARGVGTKFRRYWGLGGEWSLLFMGIAGLEVSVYSEGGGGGGLETLWRFPHYDKLVLCFPVHVYAFGYTLPRAPLRPQTQQCLHCYDDLVLCSVVHPLKPRKGYLAMISSCAVPQYIHSNPATFTLLWYPRALFRSTSTQTQQHLPRDDNLALLSSPIHALEYTLPRAPLRAQISPKPQTQ